MAVPAAAAEAVAANATLRKPDPVMETVKGTLKYTAIYAVLGALLRFVLARWGSAEIVAASAQRRSRAVLFALSTVNCAVTMAPFAMTAKDVWKSTGGSLFPAPYTSITRYGETRLDRPDDAGDDTDRHFDPATARRVHGIVKRMNKAFLGYIVHDLIMLAPEASLYPADIFHHIAGIVTCLACLANIDTMYPFLPVFFTAELSTVFLNLTWFFREFPATAAAVFPGNAGIALRDKVVPVAFALTFGVTRACLMPFLTYRYVTTPLFCNDGEQDQAKQTPAKQANVLEHMVGRHVTPVWYSLIGLQWYWFALILRKVGKKFGAAT